MTQYDLNIINMAARNLYGTIKLQLKYNPQEMNPDQHLSGIGHVLTTLTYQILPKLLSIDATKHYYNWS